MTATPNTAALTALLERVEAGEYERGGEDGPKRYGAFRDDMDAAGVPLKLVPSLMDALREGYAKYVLRALIATADTEGR